MGSRQDAIGAMKWRHECLVLLSSLQDFHSCVVEDHGLAPMATTCRHFRGFSSNSDLRYTSRFPLPAYTLHLTPYTLHLTPYTLHLIAQSFCPVARYLVK